MGKRNGRWRTFMTGMWFRLLKWLKHMMVGPRHSLGRGEGTKQIQVSWGQGLCLSFFTTEPRALQSAWRTVGTNNIYWMVGEWIKEIGLWCPGKLCYFPLVMKALQGFYRWCLEWNSITSNSIFCFCNPARSRPVFRAHSHPEVDFKAFFSFSLMPQTFIGHL